MSVADLVSPRWLKTWAHARVHRALARSQFAALGGPRGAAKPGGEFEAGLLNHMRVGSQAELTETSLVMWYDFATSSLKRGKETVRALGGAPIFHGARVIDVGCAYGGFVIAAKQAGASDVCGVDINAGYLSLAEMHLRDHGIQARLLRHDITSHATPGVLGTGFDMVLCNDVIEHVVDPEICAANLSGLLRKGGRLYLHIPNAQAVEFLLKDGHYGMFGLTLLNRGDAEAWWRTRFGPDDVYGVEHYAAPAYYVSIFSRCGIALRLLNSEVPAEPAAVIARLDVQFAELERAIDGFTCEHPAQEAVAAELVRRARGEVARYRELAGRWRASRSHMERRILAHELQTTYGVDFWQLEGTRL